MKKIFITTNRFVAGGVETTLLTLLNNFDRSKYKITLGLCCKGGELEYLIPKDIKIRYLLKFDPMKLPKLLSNIYQLFLLFLPNWLCNLLFIKEEYDTCIAYSGNMIYYIKGFKGKKTCWIHDQYFPFQIQKHILGRIRKRITLKILNKFNKIIFVSNNLKNMFVDFSLNRIDNLLFLPNAINSEIITQKAQEECDFFFNPNLLYFVSVGRLHPIKGYERLLKIMIKEREKFKDFCLLIIGEGAQKDELNKLIKENNAEEYIKLLGMQINPFKFVNQCDVFICSSFTEGYSTTISEAMILGKAIISTNCGGSDQLLENGKYGILTDNTSESLENGINQILINRELVQKYKKLSNIRAEEIFNLNKIILDIQDNAF